MELPEINTNVIFTVTQRDNKKLARKGFFMRYEGREVFFITPSCYYLPEQVTEWERY